MAIKKLVFKLTNPKDPEHIAPRWNKVDVENATCPDCKRVMFVAFMPDGDQAYAFCSHCGQYFLGE